MGNIKIPIDMDFGIPGISHEVSERLNMAKPQDLGEASRLPGVTPAAIDTLAIALSKRK